MLLAVYRDNCILGSKEINILKKAIKDLTSCDCNGSEVSSKRICLYIPIEHATCLGLGNVSEYIRFDIF